MTRTAIVTALILALSPSGPVLAQPSSPPQTDTSPSSQPPSRSGDTSRQHTGSTASSPAQSGTQIDSKSLVGSTVRGEDGKDVGRVANVMIDPQDGKVTALVVTMGRTLGVGGTNVSLGGKDVTVPWDGVTVNRDQGKLVVTMQQSTMRSETPSSRDRSLPETTQPSTR